MSVVDYCSSSMWHIADEERTVSFTLFNPVRGEFPKNRPWTLVWLRKTNNILLQAGLLSTGWLYPQVGYGLSLWFYSVSFWEAPFVSQKRLYIERDHLFLRKFSIVNTLSATMLSPSSNKSRKSLMLMIFISYLVLSVQDVRMEMEVTWPSGVITMRHLNLIMPL